MAVHVARMPVNHQEVWHVRDRAVQKLRAVPVAQQAHIGPDRGEIIERRRSHRIVIAARRDAAAVGVRLIRRDIDRIVRGRGE